MALLPGCRVTEFSRTLNIAIVGFRREDTEKRLHAQCPRFARQLTGMVVEQARFVESAPLGRLGMLTL